MKVFILAMATLLSLNTQAASIQNTLEAKLRTHNFDARSPLAELEVVDSSVLLDFYNDKIELRFTLPWSCPPNALCAMVMPMRVFIVENLDIETDECGNTIYQAEEDDRPVDGLYQRITVVDHSNSSCPQIMIYPPLETSIEYKVKFYDRLGGKPVEYTHRFTADRLM